jgi:signal peptidase I
MNEPERCTECGAMLDPTALRNLCPACLLKRGMETHTFGPESSPAADYTPPTPAELAPLFPDLEILELVGRGGMGVVYKARQKRLDRLVALKILAPSVGKDPAFADRFAREARAMAMLNHPHIVAVHDFGHAVSPRPLGEGQGAANSPLPLGEGQGVRATEGDSGLYYFLMEFVDGLNLRRLIDSVKYKPQEALAIVPQICEALQYAHDKGVVHRDIKPENVLLDKDGQVKIADFGLAKLMGREAKDLTLTGAGQIMGTPNYMAPEQIEHPQDVDHRADIYSLGVVFYQMLTGELPLGRFAPPSKKVQIDVRLDEVVLRALEKEPQRRYQHASEVKSEVETIVRAPKSAQADDTASAAAIEHARRQLKGPAIGLLVTGILNWAAAVPVGLLVGYLMTEKRDISGGEVVVAFLAPFLLMAVSILVIVAALKMKRLQAYRLAVAMSLLGIFVSPSNVIGLPIGIWALVVLSQREVRAAFALVAAQLKRRQELHPGNAAAMTDATAWKSPDTGWGWLVGKVFGVTFTSPLAYGCANLSALGFLGFLFALGYVSPDMRWCFGFSGFFGLFGLIGVAHLIESVSRPKNLRPAGSWLHKAFFSLVVLIVILLIVRAYFCEAFIVPGDCAGPEVPRGSRVLAWKLTKKFVPHDLVVYRFDGQTNLGRVVRNDGADLIVNRNGEPDAKVARDDVIGKVICVYWRASAPPPAPVQTDKRNERLPITPPASTDISQQAPANSSHVTPPAPKAQPEIPKDWRTSQAARIDALKKAYEIANKQWMLGTATQTERMSALEALLQAQLDTADTSAERISILEAMLASRRDAEKYAEVQFSAGRCTEDVVDRAMADRLEAEMRLAKEKSAATGNSSPPTDRKVDEAMRKLQDERIVSRAKAFVIADAHYRYGITDFGQRVAASNALLDAQLDAADSKAARINILQKLLENRRDLQQYAKAQVSSGRGSESDYLRAQAERLSAEGRLAEAQAAKDDAPAKAGEPVKPRGPILLYWVDGIRRDTNTAELMDKLLAAVDRSLNAGTEKLARARKLDDRLIEVALLRPDVADRQRVERLLSRPGMLEFRVLATPQKDKSAIELAQKEPWMIVGDAAKMGVARWVPVEEGLEKKGQKKDGNAKAFTATAETVSRKSFQNSDITEVLVIPDPYNITDAYITKAEVSTDNNGPSIGFTLNEAGAKLLAKLTGEHLPDESGKLRYRLGIILDGELISAPYILSVISNQGKITGNFTKEQAAAIVDALNTGSLPVPLRLVP